MADIANLALAQQNAGIANPGGPTGGGGFFSNLMGGFDMGKAGQHLSQNPEVLAILMDRLGTGLNPNNPMAGIGKDFALSSLANKNQKAQAEQNQKMMELLAEAVSNQGAVKSPIPTEHTAANQPGPTSTTITGTEDGQNEVVTKSRVPNEALQVGSPSALRSDPNKAPGLEDFISVGF